MLGWVKACVWLGQGLLLAESRPTFGLVKAYVWLGQGPRFGGSKPTFGRVKANVRLEQSLRLAGPGRTIGLPKGYVGLDQGLRLAGARLTLASRLAFSLAKAYVWVGQGLRLAPPHPSSSSHPTLGINMEIDIMPPRPRVAHAGDQGPWPGWHDVDLHVYPRRVLAGAGRVRDSQT